MLKVRSDSLNRNEIKLFDVKENRSVHFKKRSKRKAAVKKYLFWDFAIFMA